MNLKLAWTVGLLTVAIAIVGLASVSAQHPYTTQSKEQEKIFFLPRDRPKSGVGWEITTTSGEAEIALARHLANTGAKEYVAWWCPHCHEQKLLFGKEAYQIISDSIKVECDNRGVNAQPDLCEAANVSAYPTWVINGNQYSGVQNLKDLARISGYKGSNNFKYVHVPRFF
ncbi:hypothetical protein [Nostoc foliaceum]|uniref:Thioredoxin domain-containing protein n=1 Tax=Nostoc foliaceum FACHB-393 TaxID=2692915 RepID=A0ABR8IEJ0_9NOSO|nr:hypothetical protein [Nostoc foliaceum FACHB-393]